MPFLCLDSLCLIERKTYLVILYLTLMRRKHIRNLLLLFVLYKRPFISFFIQKYGKAINVALFSTKPSIGTKAFNEQLLCKEYILFTKIYGYIANNFDSLQSSIFGNNKFMGERKYFLAAKFS